MALTTTLLTDAKGAGSQVGYTLTNTSNAAKAITLGIAVRPIQANPPAQFLSQKGGAALVDGISSSRPQLATMMLSQALT